MRPFTRQMALLLVVSALVNFGFYLSRSDDCLPATSHSTDAPPSQPQDNMSHTTASDTQQASALEPIPSFSEYPIPKIDCGSLVSRMRSIEHAWEMNELRRNLTLTNPACLQEHLEEFARAFLPRIHIRQYNLHIPKTGGTSLCRLVRDNRIKAPPKLCRFRAYCPFWCNFCSTRRSITCDDLEENPFHFVGNERWLDFGQEYEFCDGFAHSITIREPVARAISNVNMWFGECNGKRNFTGIQRAERLQIVQSNYMTWSLTAGTSEYPEGFQPTSSNVALAKRMLTRFDYIIDVQAMEQECFANVLNYMGFHKTDLDHHRVAAANYSLAYNLDNYAKMNALDLEIYDFAKSLMAMDCAFFHQVKELVHVPPVPTPPPTKHNFRRRPQFPARNKKPKTSSQTTSGRFPMNLGQSQKDTNLRERLSSAKQKLFSKRKNKKMKGFGQKL